MAISAGPVFKFNPSISLMINFDPAQDPEATSRMDTVWSKLVDGGEVLMPLDNTRSVNVTAGCKINTDTARGVLTRYQSGMDPEKEGTLMFTDFRLLDIWVAAMDSAQKHNFAFNEAISLIVKCDTQEEIDHYWEKLSAVPDTEQCGWLKDKFRVSWQIVPAAMDEMMQSGTQ